MFSKLPMRQKTQEFNLAGAGQFSKLPMRQKTC